MSEGSQASAALTGLLLSLAKRHGVLLPASSNVPTQAPRVALEEKRKLLLEIAQKAGLAALLDAREDLSRLRYHPMLVLLLAGGAGNPIIRRWCAVERFFHTRHRIAVVRAGGRSVAFRHLSRTVDAPLREEDIFIAGVLAGLLAVGGCSGVDLSVETGKSNVLVLLRGGIAMPTSATDGISTGAVWQLSWQTERDPTPSPRLAAVPPVNLRVGRHTAAAFERLRDDPMHRWSLHELADTLGLSARTLQRRLAADGLDFTQAVAKNRIAVACDLLVATTLPLWAVAIEAGFTDGPHFARSFKTAVGLSPSDYRAISTVNESDFSIAPFL